MKEKDLNNNFDTLDFEYQLNITNSTAVEALNQLDTVDRNLFIMFIVNKNHLSTLSRELHLSVPFVKTEIQRIREILKNNILKIETE